MLKRLLICCVLCFLSLANCYAETKVIHILVALCDNKYQGIVPVPSALGNGQEPNNNLYWGAGFGLRTYFNKQKEWQLVKTEKNINKLVLERLVYKNKSKDVYIVADAYDGKYIKNTIQDFLNYSAGIDDSLVQEVNGSKLTLGGKADLLIYVGHNGLMDWPLSTVFNPLYSPVLSEKQKISQKGREAAVFACQSQQYFSAPLSQTGISPAIFTTNYMAPEGYVVYALVNSYVNNFSKQQTHEAVAKAYSKYQKLKHPARKLFSTEYK